MSRGKRRKQPLVRAIALSCLSLLALPACSGFRQAGGHRDGGDAADAPKIQPGTDGRETDGAVEQITIDAPTDRIPDRAEVMSPTDGNDVMSPVDGITDSVDSGGGGSGLDGSAGAGGGSVDARNDAAVQTPAALALTGSGAFGDVVIGRPKSITFTLKNSGQQSSSATTISVTPTTSGFTLQTGAADDCAAASAVAGGGGTCNIRVLFTPAVAGGSGPATLSVSAAMGATPALTVALTGNAVPIGLSLVAGKAGGAGALDALGSAARFSVPWGATYDGNGNIYVADNSNHTIRRITVASGAVVTLAGTPGVAGYVEGAAATAQFNYPQDVAYSGGSVFVADSMNGVVRRVDAGTGTVSTLATGLAGLSGIAADGLGNLYVVNGVIRKIVVATGVVSALTGTLASGGIASDGLGNLYVASPSDNAIYKVPVATGVATLLAGGSFGSLDGTGAAAQFNFPSGVVYDSGNIYVAEAFACSIRKVVVSTGEVTRIAGTYGTYSYADGTGSAALFSSPFGLTADGAGTLFVSDSYNNVIRRVSTSTGVGMVTTLAGTPTNAGNTNGTGGGARFSNPDGVASDNAGNAYVADVSNSAIRQITLATGVTTTLAGADAMFSSPRGITFDGAGNLLVGDTFNATLRKIAISGGIVSTFAGATGILGHVDLPGADARFGNVYSSALDGSGNLYVADPYDETIRKVVLSTGAVLTVAGSSRVDGFVDATGAAARFQNPFGIATDGGDNLYVTDGSTVRSIVASTGVVRTLAGVNGIRGSVDAAGTSARFASNTGIVYDGAGSLYVADSDNHTIRKVVISTGMVSTVVGVPNQFGIKLGPLPGVLNRPRGLAFAGSGRLLITDEIENIVLSAQF